MFICDICGSDFTLKQNLRRHMKIIHKLTIERYINKDAEHKCYRCKHSFVNISSLRRHEKLKHKNDFIKSFPKTKYVGIIQSTSVLFTHCNNIFKYNN